MTGQLRLVLRDQLTRGEASLADIDPTRGVVLMVEGLTRPVMFGTKKRAFLLLAMSAIRYFAQK